MNKTGLIKFFIISSLFLVFSVSFTYALPLNGTNADADRVYFNASLDLANLDQTTASANPTGNDVFLPNRTNETLAIGMQYVFNRINFSVTTAGVLAGTNNLNLSWFYSNGTNNQTDWKNLTSSITSDTCKNFTATGNCSVAWNVPTDFALMKYNDLTGYWIRINGTSDYTTNASIAQLSTVEFNVAVNVTDELLKNMTDLGAANFTTNDTTNTVNGSSNTAMASRNKVGGTYELALLTNVPHTVTVQRSGYVNVSNSTVSNTGTTLLNFSTNHTLNFTIKVLNLTDELGTKFGVLDGTAGNANVTTDSGGVQYNNNIAYINATAATTNLIGGRAGYVNKSLAVAGVSNAKQNVTSISSLLFTVRINNLTDELGTKFLVLDGAAGIVATDSGGVQYSANVAYINATAATTNLIGSRAGYVNKSLAIAGVAASGQNNTSISSLLFTVKIMNTTDELGGVLSQLDGVNTVILTTNGSVQYSANVAYINATVSSINVTASRAGYINTTILSIGVSAAAQNVTNVSSIKFTVKITNVTDELGSDMGTLDGSNIVIVTTSGSVTYSGTDAYINASASPNVTAGRVGYVNKTSTIVFSSAQNESNITGMLFTVKITVTSDAGEALGSASITLSKSGTTIATSPTVRVSNKYYYAINQQVYPIFDASITQTGYIAESKSNLGVSSSAQQAQSITLNTAPSGGGSSGGGSTTPLTPTSSSSIDKLTTDVPTSVTSTLKESGLVKLDITLNSDQSGVNLIFSKPSTSPVSTAPSGNVYQFISVSHNVQESKFKSVRFVFAVEKSWLNSNSIDSSKVSLERYETDHWTKYAASVVSQNDTSISYDATVPGLSNFAVTGDKQLTECTSGKRCNGNQIQECTNNLWVTAQTCQYGCESTTYTCKSALVDQPVQEPTKPTETPTPQEKTKTNTTDTKTPTSSIPMTYVYVGLGLLAIVAIAGIAYWKMKKKPVKYAGYKK